MEADYSWPSQDELSNSKLGDKYVWFTASWFFCLSNFVYDMKKINESFDCINCGQRVVPALKTCRNHCPFCFVSLHVDGDIPWDRSTICHAKMYPREYFISNGDMKILFECEKCHKQHWNKRAVDDEVEKLNELIKKYRDIFE